MKILFYINEIVNGGAERVITSLANHFSKVASVYFVTSNQYECEYYLDESICRVNLINFENKISRLRKNFFLIKQLRRIIKDNSIDVCISFMGEPNIRLMLATRGIKTKKILSVRSDPKFEYGSKLYDFLAKCTFKKADKIVFQTEHALDYFGDEISKKGIIIYNPIDEKFYNQLDCIQKNIVYFGRLSKEKNINMLIDAFDMIKDEINDDLYIIGDGPERDNLIKKCHDMMLFGRVHFLNKIKDIHKIIYKYKLFVLCSNVEGMPNSLMESMASGVAVIATNSDGGGVKMLMENSDFIVEKNDVADLSMKMKKILLNEDLRQQEIKKFKAKASTFKAEIIFEEWWKVINE